MFHSAELLETSAVCVPAVPGTTVDDVRAALAAMQQTLGIGPRGKATRMPFERIRAILGLAATAGEAEVFSGVESLQTRLDDTSKRLAAASAQLEEANKALASERTAHESLKEQLARDAEDGFVKGGIEAGKLRPGSKLEKALRDLFKLDREAAQEMLDCAPVVTPWACRGSRIGRHRPRASSTSSPINSCATRASTTPRRISPSTGRRGTDWR